MSIGAIVLSQVAKSLKKLRNTTRFCLANLVTVDDMERVSKEEMDLARSFILFLLLSNLHVRRDDIL